MYVCRHVPPTPHQSQCSAGNYSVACLLNHRLQLKYPQSLVSENVLM